MVDYDSWCRRCGNLEFNVERGILCKLTSDKPDFGITCSDFDYDPNQDQQVWNEITKDKNRAQRHKLLAMAGMLGAAIYMGSFYYFAYQVALIPSLIFIVNLLSYLRWYRYDRILEKKSSSLKSNILKNSIPSNEILDEKNRKRKTGRLFNWLWEHDLIKINEKHIDTWIYEEDYWNLEKIYEKCNSRLRQYLVESLKQLDSKASRRMLVQALNDRVYPVVEEAVKSLDGLGIDDDTLSKDIEKIIVKWEEEEQKTKENLEKSSYTAFQGEYLDKSKMVRLKEVKALLAKFKGSMSIG